MGWGNTPWWIAGMTVEAGAILSLKDAKAVRDIEKRRMEGAAYFKSRCETYADLDPKAREIMQFEMDKLLDKTQGRTR